MKATWINASAGTGKTTALVDHCRMLLSQGVKPQHILCITFTNNAAQEMEERIHNPEVAVKTLHSVAQGIVQNVKGIVIDRIMDSYDQEQLLRQATMAYLKEKPLAAEALSQHYSYEYFLSLLKKVLYKTQEPLKTFEGVTIEKPTIEYPEEYWMQFLTAKGTIRKKLSPEMCEEAEKVYHHVQAQKIYDWIQKNHIFLEHMNGILTHYLQLKKGYDFNDLILEATRLLEDATNLYEATRHFQHILLDEAQDTSFHQWLLFRKMIENAQSVLVVGDHKQNIYSFQEARPAFYDAFKSELKVISEFEEKTLITNYRSLSSIVTLAADKCPELNIPLQTVFRKGDGIVETINDYQHILDLLASKVILPSTGKPIEPKDILLLFRKRDETFDKVVDFLTAHHVPLRVEKKHLFQEEPLIKELMHVLDLQIYYPEDAYDIFYYDRSTLKEKGLPMLFKNIDHMMAALLDVLPLYLFDVLLDVLAQLTAPTFYTLREYLNHHPIHFEKPIEDNAISLMTIHGSKGLQAPVVYLFETSNRKPYEPFLYDIKTNALYKTPPSDIYHPSIMAIKEHNKQDVESEDHRLLYVAITRAKDRFYFAL